MKPSRPAALILGMLALLVMVSSLGQGAGWPDDPYTNLPVCTAIKDQASHQTLTDGDGGAFIVWEDYRRVSWFYDVDFTSIDVGVVVGADGSIVHTVDGGTNWIAQTSGTTVTLQGVAFSSSTAGIAVGEGGTVLWTADGGSTWTAGASGTTVDLNGVAVAGAGLGVAVGADGTIIASADGGATWAPQTSGVTHDLLDVVLVDTSLGTAVGDSGVVLHTTNGGASWAQQASGTTASLHGVDFSSANYGTAVGMWGTVIRTTDGGANWSIQVPPGYYDLYDVSFPSTNTGYAVGYDEMLVSSVLLKTTNGGSVWTIKSFFGFGHFYGLDFADTDFGTVVGQSGGIRHTTFGGDSWIDQSRGGDIYAQRLTGSGELLWAPDGIMVCEAAGNQSAPQLVSDGAGGLIAVWADKRAGNTDLYTQRLDGNGNALWSPGGVALCDEGNTQNGAVIVSDDAGGAIVAWVDYRNDLTLGTDIYAQRIDASGTPQWTDDGVVLVSYSDAQEELAAVADGRGGIIVFWRDYRGGSVDIYGRALNADGLGRWSSSGVMMSSNSEETSYGVRTVADGLGGAIITWVQFESSEMGLNTQRVEGSYGQRLWGSSGIVVRDSTFQYTHTLTSDGENGAIIAWEDNRNGLANDIYAQRIDFNGTERWSADGVPVCTSIQHQSQPALVPDGQGGALVTWWDLRSGGYDEDLFVQRLDADGVAQWRDQGLPVSTALDDQHHHNVVADGTGGGILVWRDRRSVSTTSTDIYAQRIEGNGYLGYPSPDVYSVVDVPGDQGGVALVSWSACRLDAYPDEVVTGYSVWRQALGLGSGLTRGLDSDESRFSPWIDRAVEAGIARSLASAQAQSGWVYLGEVPATYQPEYGYDAATYGDSTSAGIPLTAFKIIAHTADPFVFWTSESDSGYSVDNLAPGAPLYLMGLEEGADARLTWEASEEYDEDLDAYAIYRSETAGFTPGPATFLDTAPDTTYLDTETGGTLHYYMVTAVDVHENESDPSNEVSVFTAIGVGGPRPAPRVLTMLPHHPNPVRSSAMLEFGLPARSGLTVEVFDVQGRLVYADRLEGLEKGWHPYTLSGVGDDGRPLANGVYWYRIRTETESETHKLVIAR